MPFVVGLTGGIGSGKSTVAKLFSELGVPTLSADQLSRDIVQPGSAALTQIVNQFGSTVLTGDGELDRRKLRERVFEDETQRLWLESLLHPMINAERHRQITELKAPYVVVEIPLLLEKNLQSEVDRTLAVTLPESMQISRAMYRDGATQAKVQAIMDVQVKAEQRRLMADDLIDNGGDLESLRSQVKALHSRYLELAAQPN